MAMPAPMRDPGSRHVLLLETGDSHRKTGVAALLPPCDRHKTEAKSNP